jgi:hypothetical protein
MELNSMADILTFVKIDLPVVLLVNNSAEDTAEEDPDTVEVDTGQEDMVVSEAGMVDEEDLVEVDMVVEDMAVEDMVAQDMEVDIMVVDLLTVKEDIAAEEGQGEDNMLLLHLTSSLIRHRRAGIHLPLFLSQMYYHSFLWLV